MYEDNQNDPLMDAVGTEQDADSYLDSPNTNASSDEGATQATPQKTEEQLRKERAEAIRGAVNLKRQVKEARAEKEYLKYENQVLRNPDSIVDIYETSPELANEIAQNNWGMSFQELVKEAQKKATPINEGTIDDAFIEEKVQSVLEKQREKSEKQKLDDLPVQFFLDTDLDPRGPTIKAIMRDYEEYNPRTVAQAEKLLTMLYKQHTQDGDSEEVSFSPPSLSRKSSSGSLIGQSGGKKVSAEMRAYMEARYGKEKVQKFLKK